MLEIKETDDRHCLSCGSTVEPKKVMLNTEKYDRNIVTFTLCCECLCKLAREFKPYS